MKINARSAVSSFRQETLRTGGGPKPPSPSQENVEIVDLLNPGELVVDYNKYDSDGVPGSHVEEINTVEITQKSNDEKQVIDCMIIEDLSKIDENQIELKMQLEQPVITTPINNTPSFSAAKKILQSQNIGKRRISMSNKMDYAKDALSHTKKLKDAEHQKHMEMAEEEQKLKVALLKEQLKHAEMQSRAMEFENKAAEFRAKAAEFQMMTAQYNMEAAKSKSDK